MSTSPLSTFRSATYRCALVMKDQSDHIRTELPRVRVSNENRQAIRRICDTFIANWFDIGTELDELQDLRLPDGDPTVRARVIRIGRWLGEDLPHLHGVVTALAAAAEDDPGCGLAYLLVAEAATQVLEAFSDVAQARDAYLAAFEPGATP